jgi:hypothetical protein
MEESIKKLDKIKEDRLKEAEQRKQEKTVSAKEQYLR